MLKLFNLICWEWPWSSFHASDIFKSVALSFNFYRPIGQHACIGFLAWLEHFVWVWSHQDPSVSPHRVTGQTNKHTHIQKNISYIYLCTLNKTKSCFHFGIILENIKSLHKSNSKDSVHLKTIFTRKTKAYAVLNSYWTDLI